jgi:hypothetical protein
MISLYLENLPVLTGYTQCFCKRSIAETSMGAKYNAEEVDPGLFVIAILVLLPEALVSSSKLHRWIFFGQ